MKRHRVSPSQRQPHRFTMARMMPTLFLVVTTLVVLLLLETCQAAAYSLYNNNINDIADFAAKTLSQKSITRETLRHVASSNSRSNSRNGIHENTIRMMPAGQTPMVPYKAPNSDYAQFIDINAAMYRDRTVMISRYIDEAAANEIIAILLYLRKQDAREPISLYFNVPGAQLRPALAIYDLIENTKAKGCRIETVNLALCAGMSAMLCSAGTKGYRRAMPNARFLLQRTGLGQGQVFRGQATDIALEVKNVKNWNDRMELELSKLTGQDVETIQHDLRRNFYLTSEEAVRYGLIDAVLLPSPRKRAARGGEANLGAFEGDEEQKYQGQENQGGWGSSKQRQQSSPPPSRPPPSRKDDDDEPKIAKG